MDWLKDALVLVISLLAVFTDAKWRKIPNWLTFPAVAIGFALNSLQGWDGIVRSIGGFVLALLIMLPLFSLDLLKAGDVKLVVAWGTIKGLGQPIWQSFALWAFLYGALFGGFMSIVIVFLRKTDSEKWRRIGALLGIMLGSPHTLAHIAESSPLKIPMPYGIALGLGSFSAIALEKFFGMPFPFLGN